MRGKVAGRRLAGVLAWILFVLTFLPHLFLTGIVYGAVSFGGGEISYNQELVKLWDQLAEREGLERTDFIGHMTRTYPHPGIVIYKQQTSISPGGRWKDYEYRNMYCISHSRELAENPDMAMETTAVWYIKKEPYTLQNIPDFITNATSDEYSRRFNFLIMAYAADHEACQGTVNSDPVIGTAGYYLCQSFCTLAEEAKFTGEREHDWGMYRQHASQIAERYHPSELGSSQVYSDMMREMEGTFHAVWNTAKLAADCTESSDDGYIFHPQIALEADGMYHARYPLTSDIREFFGAASVIPYGDWHWEFTEKEIDFKSQTGQMPEGGLVARMNLDNVNGIIRKRIGRESIRELHMPVRLKDQWSLTFAQGNLIANLENGLCILVGSPQAGAQISLSGPSGSSVARYKHTERWQADYVVNLRKLDSETGKPLEGAWFDILEAFDEGQLEGSILEDDNWDNDRGSQFVRWSGWDSPCEGGDGCDPCKKDQQVTDEEGWLTEAESPGAGQLQNSGIRAHRDTKYYSYTKGYCGGHPKPDEDDEEAQEEYERQIEICQSLVEEGGFYHDLDGGARRQLKDDRDRHYEEFVSLTYQYSARELAAREGYILHNQDTIHRPFENIYDGIHKDTVPIETVTVYSSQYYALAGGRRGETEENENQILLEKTGGNQEQEKNVKDSETGNGAEFVINAKSDKKDKDRKYQYLATESNAVPAVKTEIFPGEEADLDEVWILDEDGEDSENDLENEQEKTATWSNAVRILPGMIRTTEHPERVTERLKAQNSREHGHSVNMQPSQISVIAPADSDYSGQGGSDWIFEVYDHRTEGEIHINKKDLDLKRGESEEYDSYGDSQGDGTLEGAVYGLFAAEDLIHPDGKTGVVYEKGNLVAVTATDKNGDASFMAITEKPGTVYDYTTGMTAETGFEGPKNQYTENMIIYTSNPDRKNGERWCYPITDNQSLNGNCWIGRPLLLGSYYIQELTRSEGYELSVYGIDAEVSNRSSWQNRDGFQTEGVVQVEKISGNVRQMEDTGKEEAVTEIFLSGRGLDFGCDISIKNIAPESEPSFWLTTTGKKEVYRKWKEPEICYETVQATPGTPVIINGRKAEAEKGEIKRLPNGETVVVEYTEKTAITPEKLLLTGEEGGIRIFTKQYIPDLTGIVAEEPDVFLDRCNQALEEIGLWSPEKDSPYFLIKLGEDKTLWAQRLYDFFASEDCPAFNGARLQEIIWKEGECYGVLKYSFLSDGRALPVVYSASDQTFYIKTLIHYTDGTDGYLYRGCPLAALDETDYEMGVRLYRWVRVPNVKPEKEKIGFYEDLSLLSYVSAQEFKSYWIYGEGDLLRKDNGDIYEKECLRYVEKSGYQVVETAAYERTEAEYDRTTGIWRIHGEPKPTSGPENWIITIRYGNRFAGEGGRITATAVPSANLTGTYVRPVVLTYPGQYKIWEDAGTRAVPEEVLERVIVQKIRVEKTIENGEFTDCEAGENPIRGMGQFRFKVYLRSNLTRLYRSESGEVIWQDRKGREMDADSVLRKNRIFPGQVPQIYTKVLHQTAPLCQNSQNAVIANEMLYGYTDGIIHEDQNQGYTSVLEVKEQREEDQGSRTEKIYNYDKFFDAMEVANHDKWDDRSPSYTSWQPIGNVGNRSEETLYNAQVSDMVRQFAIDWYLEEEIKKRTVPVKTKEEREAQKGNVSYGDELLDQALREAIKKAENYLKPFFAYDLDEIYAIWWDGEENGGSDEDFTTLSADLFFENVEESTEKGCYGISICLPYGTYVVAEQQPRYAGSEYERNLKDFRNKHYETDRPKEVVLPSLHEDEDGMQGKLYDYDAGLSWQEMEKKYRIRFGQEDHVVHAHNHHGDFEIYKYGMDIDLISNGPPQSPGAGDYFAMVQEKYKPCKSAYNTADERTEGKVDFYLAEGHSGRMGIAADYRYNSVSEHNTADSYGLMMSGVQTVRDGEYAPVLVPWSATEPESTRFTNRYYAAKLRLEKLDSETHENILHDSGIFSIYAARREDSEEGAGKVCFYEKDTTIVGTRGFLESMGASDIRPVKRQRSLRDYLSGKKYGPGNLCTGVVPAGTPICEESGKMMLTDGQGENTAVFQSFRTVRDGRMEDEEQNGQSRRYQTTGYLKTPQPLGAGVYVICEEKAPSGYARSKPLALEIYSDKITYYKEGDRDRRVAAAIYKEEPEEGQKKETKDPAEAPEMAKTARINVENTPIKLTVEKLKEASADNANTTADKTVTYKVSGRIDGKLTEIGNNPDYIYARDGGRYLGYGWRKGTLEYLAARKAAGEQVEIAFEGDVFAGYGYVTRTLETADDENKYVEGARMALFDAILLSPSGDTQDHAFEGLEIQRNSTNNVTRMYVKKGYAGERTEFVKNTENVWGAEQMQRADTDILYYDLDSLEMIVTEIIDGSRITFGYDSDHRKVPVEMMESDKKNFDRTDTEHSLFAFRGGLPYLEFAGGDFTKLQYSAQDKLLTVGEGTLVYHLDREGNRDSLVDPYTGMAYVPAPGKEADQVMVWPVNIHRDEYGNVIARDKITTSRPAVIGENQDCYQEEKILDVVNHSGRDIPAEKHPSYDHTESGSVSGTWKSEKGERSHEEITIPVNCYGQNLNGQVLEDRNNGIFEGLLRPVYDRFGLPVYYQKSRETYNKGTKLYDRNGDFVRYQSSDNLEEYNNNAYVTDSHDNLYDGKEALENQTQKPLFHRQGEGYILENIWTSSDKTPNDPFHTEKTDGQPDVLKRIPAGNYIMEELESPKGYLKGFPTGVVVRESQRMQYTSMVDKTTKVEIAKISDVSGEPLPGAELTLFRAKKVYAQEEEKGYYLEKISEEPVQYEATDSQKTKPVQKTARWITGKEPVYAEGIPIGTYLLEETRVPEGFVSSEPAEVEIVNTAQVQVFFVHNDHTKVEIEKYVMEGDERKPLAGAGFALYPAKPDENGEVRYDPYKMIDTWTTCDPEEYTAFIPAFEEMYRNYGTEKDAIVQWSGGGEEYTARQVSSDSADVSLEGGKPSLHPVSAVLMFATDRGKTIRVTVSGQDSFQYQFDYRRLSDVNDYACSYVTPEGMRRFDCLPAGGVFVLTEIHTPKGYAKARDQVIRVKSRKDVQRYSVENTEGKLYVSKIAEGRPGELAGAHLSLYRAGDDGRLIQNEEYLEAEWISGSDGVYGEKDFVNGKIPEGYHKGDLKPHEIGKLEDGIYWLTEKKSLDFYALSEPIRIDYRQKEEIRIVQMKNSPISGTVEVRKTDSDGQTLEGAVFELAAYNQRNLRSPVFVRQISDTEGIIRAEQLPAGEAGKDGRIEPYLYKMKEIIPPDGYETNTQIFTWMFEPGGQTAEKRFTVADRKTRVFIGKRDFDLQRNGDDTGFLAGAKLAIYEIKGRDEKGHVIYEEENPCAVWITKENQEQEVEGLIAGRSYLLKELSAPKGYGLMEPIMFTMSSDGRKMVQITNQINTISVHAILPDHDSIQAVTLKGRFAVRVEYEICDKDGKAVKHWIGNRDGYILRMSDGLEEGSVYTITERTLYSDGSFPVTGLRTMRLHFDEMGCCSIPGRGPESVRLKFEHEDGTEITAFGVTEAIQEKVIYNNVSPENPEITMINRNGYQGDALNPNQAVFGTVTVVNDSRHRTDMEVTVTLGPGMEILDPGGGTIRGNQIIYRAENVSWLEKRTVFYAVSADSRMKSATAAASVRYQGRVRTTSKTVPVLQKDRLIISHELTGSGKNRYKEEWSEFEIHLYNEKGEELKGRYEYEGSKHGFLKSGDTICLAGNEFVSVNPGFYKNIQYRVMRKEDGKEMEERSTFGVLKSLGSCAVFTRSVSDSSDRELLQKGESYVLREYTDYSDGTCSESNRMMFTLDENVAMKELTVWDKKTRVSLSKIDFEDRESLTGCYMRLKDREGREIASWISGKDPCVLEGALIPGENYCLEETEPGEGYGRAEEIWFTASQDGIPQQVVMEDKKTKVIVSKKEVLGIGELAGNQMRIKTMEGREVVSWISGDKPYELSGVLIAGETYILEEVQPADGFWWSEEIIFTVSRDGTPDRITMENQKTRIEIIKADGNTKEPLQGAWLQIQDEEGQIYDQWISGEEGHEITGKLAAGKKYYLCERKAPEGYQISERMEFWMPRKEENLTMVFQNYKKENKNKTSPGSGPGSGPGPGIRPPEEEIEEPGRITARYSSEISGTGQAFLEDLYDMFPGLSALGDRTGSRWYLVCFLISLSGIVIAFFAIRMTKYRRFVIIDRIEKKKYRKKISERQGKKEK